MRKNWPIFGVLGLIAVIWLAYGVWRHRYQPHYKNFDVPAAAKGHAPVPGS